MEFRIFYLLPEFSAYTFVLLCPRKTAGTVAASVGKSFLHGSYNLLVLIQTNGHNYISFMFGKL